MRDTQRVPEAEDSIADLLLSNPSQAENLSSDAGRNAFQFESSSPASAVSGNHPQNTVMGADASVVLKAGACSASGCGKRVAPEDVDESSHVKDAKSHMFTMTVSKKNCPHNNNNCDDKTKNAVAAKDDKVKLPDWCYEDIDAWPLDASVAAGASLTERRQSPIDLRLSQMRMLDGVDADPLRFHRYDALLDGRFVNTGHSVQFLPEDNDNNGADKLLPEISGAGLSQRFRFVQYHYHWSQSDIDGGSEHTIGGLRYAGELHLVHRGVDDASQLAVVGVFLRVNADANGEALAADAVAIPRVVEAGRRVQAPLPQRLDAKLPANRRVFVRYDGSLTTPPCTENVTWTLFSDPVDVTPDQMATLRSVRDRTGRPIPCNCRPVQPLNQRQVFLAL